jgi:hypothetical protein
MKNIVINNSWVLLLLSTDTKTGKFYMETLNVSVRDMEQSTCRTGMILQGAWL